MKSRPALSAALVLSLALTVVWAGTARAQIGALFTAAGPVNLSMGGASVAALIDARRGQVYARFVENGIASGPDEALSLDVAAVRIGRMPAGSRLIGSGAALFAEAFPDLTAEPRAGPDPEALARLAAAADPTTAAPRPLYLRAPDAVPPTRLPGQARPARPA